MIDINTTRKPSGDMQTTTSGGGIAGGANLGGLFADLIKAKLAAKKPDAAPKARFSQPPPIAAPVLGAQQSAPAAATPAKPATRMRRVQQRSPFFTPMGGAGLTYDDVPETQLADGSWSLDAVHGTLGGNEAAARQKMAYLNEQAAGVSGDNAAQFSAQEQQRDGFDPRGFSSPRAPINPYNRNNDARGEKFGMDYNNRRPIAEARR